MGVAGAFTEKPPIRGRHPAQFAYAPFIGEQGDRAGVLRIARKALADAMQSETPNVALRCVVEDRRKRSIESASGRARGAGDVIEGEGLGQVFLNMRTRPPDDRAVRAEMALLCSPARCAPLMRV